MSTKMPIGQFVAGLEAAYKRGDGYIMGARGQNPRTGSLDLNVTSVSSSWKENGYYFNQYSGSQRTQALKWRKNCVRVWDCNGMAEGLYEIFSGKNINTQARYNYSSWCDPKGSGMIPKAYRVPGAAVFKESTYIHHVGYLYKPVIEGKPEGDWYVIEAKGVMYGVVRTKLLSGGWNKWGLMTKYFDYSDTAIRSDAKVYTLGERLLKNGSTGDDVKQLQEILLQLGYSLPKYGADGDYGTETIAAVKKLQIFLSVENDGEYGDITHGALMAYLERDSAPDEDDPATTVKVKVTASQSAYVRNGPGTGYSIITVVHHGAEYDSSAVADNGWFCISVNGKAGWISPKMAGVI